MSISIKSWRTGHEIYSGDFNSIKECLEHGISEGVDFSYAELNYAELNYAKLNDAELNYAKLNYAKLNDAKLNDAKLNGAELNYAELNYAKLNDAKLNDAKLNYAELNYAKLNYAKLNGAKLNGAKLNYATGSNKRVSCMQFGVYSLVAYDNICHGGCTTKTLDTWLNYEGDGLSKEDLNYLNNVTKPFIKIFLNNKTEN